MRDEDIFHVHDTPYVNLLLTSSFITVAIFKPTKLSRYSDAYADPLSASSSTFTPSDPPSSISSRMIPRGFSNSKDNNACRRDDSCNDLEFPMKEEGENDSALCNVSSSVASKGTLLIMLTNFINAIRAKSNLIIIIRNNCLSSSYLIKYLRVFILLLSQVRV